MVYAVLIQNQNTKELEICLYGMVPGIGGDRGWGMGA